MIGLVGERVRELIRQICKGHDVEILKGHVSKGHVHLFVPIPPWTCYKKVDKWLSCDNLFV